MQRCSSAAEVQRCRGAELQTIWRMEMLNCRDAEIQRCRGAGEVQMYTVQRCRGAEVQIWRQMEMLKC